MQETEKTNNELKKNLILLVFVLAFCFVFFELIVRIMWTSPSESYGYPPGFLIPDFVSAGYKNQANFSGFFVGKGYENISIKTNSKGLRDYEHDYIKNNKTIRILGLGDSMTFGAGTEYEDTYLRILEKKLISSGRDVEIIKAGVGGYNLDEEYAYYFDEGYKYNPDIVLYGFVPNDIDNNLNLTTIKENVEKYGDFILKESSFEQTVKKNCKSCIFVYSLIFNYDKKYYETMFSYWDNEKKAEHFNKKLLEIKNNVTNKNATLVIILFPYNPQFENSLNYGFSIQEKIKKLAQDNNISVIDLSQNLDVPNYKDYYLFNDICHLNKNGNELTAETIKTELIRRKIL